MDQPGCRTEEERAYYSLSRRVYDVLAPFYDVLVRPIGPLRHDVVQIAAPAPTARVLDVATGTGAQARAFAEACDEVVGVDLSEAMLRIARKKNALPNLTFIQADATDLPFPERAFDLSCISFALHEMPRSVRARTLSELSRVTKPGGSIVVVDYALPRGAIASWIVFQAVKLYERDSYAAFVRSDLRAELTEAGVGAIRAEPRLRGTVRIWTGTRGEGSPKRARSRGVPADATERAS